MTVTPSTLLFVDPSVSNYESLLQGLGSDTQVVVLDVSLDGLGQMTDALAQHTNLQSVQILSHGEAGRLQLGSSLVTTDTLAASGDRLQLWSQSLSPNADILLLGCDVGAGDAGSQFIQTLADLTGADVAASTNLTGHGGDWVLEAFTGNIEAPLTLQPAALQSYQGSLRSVLLFDESFTGTTVASGPWIFGKLAGRVDSLDPYLTARSTTAAPAGGLPGAPGGAVDAPGAGALRLTEDRTDQSTFVIYNQALSSSAGFEVTFDFYAYDGNGADGIGFYLIDGSASPNAAGGFGGALGYAARLSPGGNAPGAQGLEGGYLGIGFDAFGNFANRFDGETQTVMLNGGTNGRVLDSITVRGPGTGNTGYAYITHTTLPGGASIDVPNATNRAEAQRTARIVLDTDRSLTIFIDTDGRDRNGLNLVQVLRIADITAASAANQPIPTTFKFGFGASTGGQTNIHEINNLEIRSTQAPPEAQDLGITLQAGTTVVALTGANALNAIDTDPDPADRGIESYVITKLPTQGALVRGNGTTITSLPAGGLVLGLTAAANLSYVPNNPNNFTGDRFEYTAVDKDGARDATPAIVTLIPPGNTAPTAQNLSLQTTAGTTVVVPPLAGSDPDTGDAIAFYTITRVPLETQGTLRLGGATGVIVQTGDRLTPAQVSQLFFSASTGFTETAFQYIATDTRGAFSAPATVTIGTTAGVCVLGLTSVIANPAGGTLTGTANSDVLTGSDGNDVITGSLCSDTISGEAGNDTLGGGKQADSISGGAGADTIFGGNGADLLNGDNGADVINGEAGNDSIFGGLGNDDLLGGDGNDVIQGGDGNDLARGSLGNDSIAGGAGDDTLQGGKGNDTLVGGLGNDSLLGFEENDTLFGDEGADIIDGGVGDDVIDGGVGNDDLLGNEGNDVIQGGDGNDFARGSLGTDSISGGAGDDTLQGGKGNDTLVGGLGNDSLLGFEEDDILFGEEGFDILDGGVGNDTISGGADDDTLIGGEGNDSLSGNAGNDTLSGDLGDDVLSGGAGDDLLRGRGGNDVIAGGSGNDAIRCGRGNDVGQGGEGNDSVFGRAGDDQLFGDDGDDLLIAEDGQDQLSGGLGADVLSGGTGADLLTGGAGADFFLYDVVNTTALALESNLTTLDEIADFTPTDGDRLSFRVNGTTFVPVRLANAGTLQSATLTDAVATAYQDKNQQLADAQPLKPQQATFFTWNSDTYLVSNVGTTTAFDANQTFLVKLTGFSLGADASLGILNAANYFVTPTLA